MFSPDVRLEGFTHDDWQRLLSLFRPLRPSEVAQDPQRPQGLVLALHDGGKLRKLLHSQVGRLRLDDLQRDWPITAEQLAGRHDASWAISLERGALEDIMEGLAARTKRQDDLTQQILTLLSLIQGQLVRGRIDLWPHRLQGIPVPTEAMIESTLDTVCPAGKTMLLGLFDGDELWTSMALRRGEEGVDLILGPDQIRRELGLLSGDFRRDHRHLARFVADYAGPLSLGCFAEHQTFRALEVDPTPGAWALAVAVRDVVLHPVPVAMALPLGLDVGRAALGALREVAARLDPAGVLTPTLAAIRDVTLGQREVREVLGFNPFEVLRKLLARQR